MSRQIGRHFADTDIEHREVTITIAPRLHTVALRVNGPELRDPFTVLISLREFEEYLRDYREAMDADPA